MMGKENGRSENEDFQLGKLKPKKPAAFRELIPYHYHHINKRERKEEKKCSLLDASSVLSHLLSSVWLFVIDPASGS